MKPQASASPAPLPIVSLIISLIPLPFTALFPPSLSSPLSPSLSSPVSAQPAAPAAKPTPNITNPLANPLTIESKARWYILIACCLASCAKLLEPPIWIFNPPHDLPFEIAWRDFRLFAAFTGLITVTFLLGGGVLGDLYGRRRVLLLGLAGYIAGNLLAMTLPQPFWHLAARGLAIAFGAAAIPLSLAMINITFSGRDIAIAIAIFTVFNSLATQLAWAQGVFLAGLVGWRAPYILPVLTAAAAIIMVARHMPETLSGPRRLLDTIIYTGWTLIVFAVFFALIGWPFADDSRWGIILVASVSVGGIGTALVIWWNRRTSLQTEVQQRFRLRDLIALVITGLILSVVLIGYGVRTYAYFQIDQGMSNVIAVIALAPILIGSLVGVLLIVRAVRHWRARAVIAGSLLTMAVAILLTALLPAGASYRLFIIPLFIFGVGYLVGVTVWISAFLRTAVDGYFGLNAAINRASGMLGAAIGAAVTGNLLATWGMNYFRQGVAQFNLTDAQLATVRDAFQQLLYANPDEVGYYLAQLPKQVGALYFQAYAQAYDDILYFLTTLCILCAVVIFFGLRRSIRAEQVRPSATTEHATTG